MADAATIAVYSAQLTALEGSIKALNNFSQGITADALPSVVYLQTQHDLLEYLFQQASNIILQLEGQGEGTNRRGPFMAMYCETKTDLLKWIRVRERAERRDASPRGQANALEQTLIAGPSRPDHLPRIELPRFNGSPTEWSAFRSRFEKRVSALTEDADKYAFLGKCFERYEPARNASEAFENSGMPFDQAWRKLEERFYKQRIAFEGYFFNFLRHRRGKEPNPRTILGLVDAVDTMLSATKQIAGQTSESDKVANGLLICLVKERLDEQTLMKLEERLDLQKLYSWKEFKEELEKMANQLTCKTAVENAHATRKANKAAAYSATKTSAGGSKPPIQQSRECAFCANSSHATHACKEFGALSIEARREETRKKNLCYNCLSKTHNVRNCTSNGRCRDCKGRHHTMLHENRGQGKERTTKVMQ
ncbi:uncharacterized protein LOC129766131 [Toxorhynchites rutilus septentrionalis]|uniref:uncharacterized protein LOC129766131 n=1 Tax=Toxorhynchites rutilus septentrionalis TaxID=329112 RepID=UPI00247B09EA|nr:uncharacterized protein LOC129766131 [Toxorhynchites rutilus septentrionalis]